MEPVTSVVSAILVVLQEIAKAEKAAHRNRTRCRDLAERARAVSNVLRDASSSTTTAPGVSRDGASSSSGTTKRVLLSRLREALDDALKLVRSCCHQQCGDDDDSRRLLLSWLSARLYYGRARAARFDDVGKRIDNCLAELNAASGAIVEKKIDSLVAAAAERITKNPPPIKDDAKAGKVPPQKGGATGKGGQQNGGKKDGQQNGGKKGSQQNGGQSGQGNGRNGGKPTRGTNKAAAAARPTPALVLARAGVVPFPPLWLAVEENATSCSVM